MLKGHTSRIARFTYSNRKHSVSSVATSILTSAAFALASLGAVPDGRPRQKTGNPLDVESLKKTGASNPGTGPTMAPMLVAPLFLQDEQFSSTISLVNASNVNTYATITLRSLSGQTILQKKVPLAGSSPGQVEVQQLLLEADSRETRGSIVVEESPDLKGMAVLAQLSITYQGSRASYIDEELAMPDPAMGSTVLRGVARGNVESMLVAISSLAQVAQQIRVDCLGDAAAPRSKSVELAPNATVITEPCRQVDSRTQSQTDGAEGNSGELGAVGVQLVSNAGPGQFVAFGIVRRVGEADKTSGAVPFADPKLAVSSSTIFAGIPVGRRIYSAQAHTSRTSPSPISP
jgi:hypothetical protein